MDKMIYKKIINSEDLYGYSNPYLAIDGSEHMELSGVEKANNEFWSSIIKNGNDESLKETYKKINEILWYKKVDYNIWDGFYRIFELGCAQDLYSDEFICVFASALINADVKVLTDLEAATLQIQIGVLSSTIEQLSTPGRR